MARTTRPRSRPRREPALNARSPRLRMSPQLRPYGFDPRVSSVATDFTVQNGGVTLSGEESGEGPAVLLLHGLTATRRYVVMGSRALERSGHRVIQYDARAHGRSSPAPKPDAYTYELLGDDAIALLDERGIERAVFAGA